MFPFQKQVGQVTRKKKIFSFVHTINFVSSSKSEKDNLTTKTEKWIFLLVSCERGEFNIIFYASSR